MDIGFWIGIILYSIICSALSGSLANKKGFEKETWFIAGFFFGILGLIAAAGLPSRSYSNMSLTKTCNKCFEEIKKEAMICKYCGNKFSDEDIINELFLLLKNESLSIRIKALKSLSILKPKDISVRLIEFLLDTKSDVLSEQDLIFLQSQYRDKIIELGDPSILPFIEAQLNDNVKLEIRLILIELCGVFGDASVIPKLINYLNKDWLKDVSRQSIIKIGVSAIPILNQYLPSASKIQKKIINEILVELNK